MKSFFISLLLLLISCSVFAQGNINRAVAQDVFTVGSDTLSGENAITVKAQHRIEGLFWSDWLAVGTLTHLNGDSTDYFVLADLDWWTFTDSLKIILTSSSDTLYGNALQTIRTEGQLTLGITADTTVGDAQTVVSGKLKGR